MRTIHFMTTASLVLSFAAPAAAAPDYWKKTASEKIMDQVYKGYSEGAQRSRDMSKSMRESGSRAPSYNSTKSPASFKREPVSAKTCAALIGEGRNPTASSIARLEGLVKENPWLNWRNDWRMWPSYSTFMQVGYFVRHCPIPTKESDGLLAIVKRARKPLVVEKPAPKAPLSSWGRFMLERERTGRQRAWLDSIPAGSLPAQVIFRTAEPPAETITHAQADRFKPSVPPGMQLKVETFGRQRIEFRVVQNGQTAFSRRLVFSPQRDRPLGWVVDEFFCRLGRGGKCFEKSWDYDSGRRVLKRQHPYVIWIR